MTDTDNACKNTDRELWRDGDDYYADSIHVTQDGGIGINCGGTVIVMSLQDWFLQAVDRGARRSPPADTDRKELADEIERLFEAHMQALDGDDGARAELRQYLWDNKVGILRALQSPPVTGENESCKESCVQTTIALEKKLLTAMGRIWSARGPSLADLVDEAAAKLSATPAPPMVTEEEIVTIFRARIRLVASEAAGKKCEECDGPLTWRVKPGTLEAAARDVLALLRFTASQAQGERQNEGE